MRNPAVLCNPRYRGCFALFVAVLAAGSLPTEGQMAATDEKIDFSLDAGRNYALASVKVGASTFPSGGECPTFVLFDRSGTEHVMAPTDARWRVEGHRTANGARVTYSHAGLTAVVEYISADGILLVRVTPESEGDLKFRALSDGGAIASVPSNVSGATESGFILRPYLSGELLRFPGGREEQTRSDPQSWDYKASFVAFGCNNRGLIVRCPQYGAVWSAGTRDVGGTYSLVGGLTADFRPRRDNPGPYPFWDLPLVEPKLEIQLVPVGDVNGDGVFNWVDIGVAYRDRFIRRDPHLDPAELHSVSGKIDVALPYEGCLNYGQLIEQIRTIDFAPQRWWLVGAHTPPGHEFACPPHAPRPDPSHNGPGDYGYFAFRRDAAAAGARIGIHELFQDTSELNPEEFDRVPVRIQEYGDPMGTWKGESNGREVWDLSKALHAMVADGSWLRDLDEHFRQWDVGPGDSWHWDCFTAFGGRPDFSADHPTTHGADIRLRIEILKQIAERGIYLTSEGLQEGLHEVCGFAWSAKTEPGWQSSFAGGEPVPLVPVLFQGKTYYSVSWHPAWNLLYGGKCQFEGTALGREGLVGQYFGHIGYWSKVADRTVANMTRTRDGWIVEYTEGGRLTVDLAEMTPAMTFSLEVDGETFDPDHPPTSSWGVSARRVDGKYVVTDRGKKTP
jgi:hypothetical protein